MEMRDKVLSSVGTHDMDTIGYRVYHVEDIEFHWEGPDLNVDVEILISPFNFNDFEIGSMDESPLSDWQRARQGKLPLSSASNKATLRETNPTPCFDEKSPLWNKNWEYFQIC